MSNCAQKAVFNIRCERSHRPASLFNVLIGLQYAFSVLSIVGGVVALLVTVGVSLLFFFVSLARLDIKRFTIDRLSSMFEPAYQAMCSAIMVDHENTNPIKLVALDWFCCRLRQLRRAEVHKPEHPCLLMYMGDDRAESPSCY
jgi:hypothetical protein